MVPIVIFASSCLFTMIAWIGNRLVNTLDRMESKIGSIDKTLTALVSRHDDLQERVDNLEKKVFNLN